MQKPTAQMCAEQIPNAEMAGATQTGLVEELAGRTSFLSRALY